MNLTNKQKETAKALFYLFTLPLIILLSMYIETNF
jgi:hypothetical protein